MGKTKDLPRGGDTEKFILRRGDPSNVFLRKIAIFLRGRASEIFLKKAKNFS